MRASALWIPLAIAGGLVLAPRARDDGAGDGGPGVVVPEEAVAVGGDPVPEPPLLAGAPGRWRVDATGVPSAAAELVTSSSAESGASPAGGADGASSPGTDVDLAHGTDPGPAASPPDEPDAALARAPAAVAEEAPGSVFDLSVVLEVAPDAPGVVGVRNEGGAKRRLDRILGAVHNALCDAGRPTLAIGVGPDGTRLGLGPLDAASEAAVTKALDATARLGGDAVPLVVEVYADGDAVAHALGVARPPAAQRVEVPASLKRVRLPAPVATLNVDAPFDHRVRAFAGASLGYLADYDIEIGMGGVYASTPILGELDLGVALTAGLEAEPAGGHAVEIDVTWTSGRDPFEIFRTSLATGAEAVVAVQIPKYSILRFQGRLPAEAGRRWLLGLGQGAVALATVGEAVAGPAPTPGWCRPPDLPVNPTGGSMDPADCERLDVTIEPPSRRGPGITGRLWSHGGHPEVETLSAPDLSGTALEERLGTKVSVGADDRDALSGGIRLTVSRLEDEAGARAFDVVLDVGEVDRGPEREIAALQWAVERFSPATLRLPTTRRTSIPVRFRLAHGASATRRVHVTLSEGGPPEIWDLTISRS